MSRKNFASRPCAIQSEIERQRVAADALRAACSKIERQRIVAGAPVFVHGI